MLFSNGEPEAGIIIPFRRGSVQPVDVGAFKGVRLEVRGVGNYRIRIITLSGPWHADISASAEWDELTTFCRV